MGEGNPPYHSQTWRMPLSSAFAVGPQVLNETDEIRGLQKPSTAEEIGEEPGKYAEGIAGERDSGSSCKSTETSRKRIGGCSQILERRGLQLQA